MMILKKISKRVMIAYRTMKSHGICMVVSNSCIYDKEYTRICTSVLFLQNKQNFFQKNFRLLFWQLFKLFNIYYNFSLFSSFLLGGCFRGRRKRSIIQDLRFKNIFKFFIFYFKLFCYIFGLFWFKNNFK